MEFANLISFSNTIGPVIRVDLTETTQSMECWDKCNLYYTAMMVRRSFDPTIQKNIMDFDNVINKAEKFILKLENATI